MIVISIHHPGCIEPPFQACLLPSAKIKLAFVLIKEGTSAVEMGIERLIVNQKRHKNMYNRSMVSPTLPASFSFSQSSLQDYSDCPRRFQLRFIEKLEWPAVETEPVLENEHRQKEGQLFHRMVQQHLIGLSAEKISQTAKSPNLSRWWENYLGSHFEFSGYTQYTELTLAVPVGIYSLVAKYDFIAVKPGERIFIYDWKTYHKRPRDEWMAARMQTRVYCSMVVQAGAFLNSGNPISPEQIEMVYWYADYPTEPSRFPYNSTQNERDWETLKGLIIEIGNHRHFPLTEDEKKCVYCPFRSYCNRGVKAGRMDEIADSDITSTDINFEQIAEIEY
jgi:CRISPR/Cas system-associated exonuclease Cas4 (RecB family)